MQLPLQREAPSLHLPRLGARGLAGEGRGVSD